SSSGLPVSLQVEAGPATLAAGMLTVTGAGTVVVSAEQDGDATHDKARITRRFNLLHAGFREEPSRVPLHSASRIQVVGQYAFLTVPGPWDGTLEGSGELRVLDISDLGNPLPVATLGGEGPIGSVEIAGNLACLSVRYRRGAGTALPGVVHVLDISRPGQPVRLGTFQTDGMVTQIRLVGDRLYIAQSAAGSVPVDDLIIVDLSQPSQPVKIGGLGAGQGYSDLEIIGNTLYMAGYFSGLAILDTQDPANPVRRDPGTFRGSLTGLTVLGDVAYLTGALAPGRMNVVQVVDVSDASHPRLIRTLEMLGYPEKVQVIGNHAYLLEALPPNKATPSFTRMHVLDIADPADPVGVGIYEKGGSFTGFNVIGGLIHLGLSSGYMSPPSVPVDSPPVSIHFGLPQRLERTLPDIVPFVRSPITNLAASDAGLPITFRVLDGPATVEQGSLLLNGVGPVTVRAEQAGDGTYVPVATEWTFRVGPPALGLRRSAGGLEAFWPDGWPGLQLQQAASLSPTGAWSNVGGPRIHANGEELARMATDNPRQFFRLQGP
ncbi:MAG: LVIVD repeat-containing protein, partial [Limisphaerales bacterium]